MDFEDIVKDITQKTHLSAKDAAATVHVFIDIVTDELKNDGKAAPGDPDTI